MASHQYAIAKASFAAGLLRPDFSAITRDEIANFHQSLDAALSRCTPQNIQTCKDWLVKNVIPSAARTTVLAKYLVSLAKSFQRDASTETSTAAVSSLLPERKALHILYLLNDLFHHAKYHQRGGNAVGALSAAFQPFLLEIITIGARNQRPRIIRRLHNLLDIWVQESYYDKAFADSIRYTIENTVAGNAEAAVPGTAGDVLENNSSIREAPYIMPQTHGEPNTPFYDLPAGNLMPHIIPNSTVPIRPQAVKPLQFLAGPADESLANAVKDFLREVERIDEPLVNGQGDDGFEIDGMGQSIIRDETGEIDLNASDTYFGWSRAFCEKMKRRRDQDQEPEDDNRRRRSYSSSRSRSRSPLKRRRYSEDDYSNRSDSRSRSRSRTSSRRHKAYRQSRSSSRSRSRSYSPAPAPVDLAPMAPQVAQPVPPSPSLPFDMPLPGGPFPPSFLGPDGRPLPPPRPPNWTGPWPPPPPPPFLSHQGDLSRTSQKAPPSYLGNGEGLGKSHAR
ncbi:MAG: hypothetical protein Q9227_001374 [Pyrenula ochraceoflavens]